ncbi:PaaI family thioesterase [Vulcanisaeta sp. JCM 14467]|uniref:PaaI family thioesterase n=1 Tax=Vulcanisaeta sp. JCM 14467 TaxID=1295370 RepID=UPI000B3324C3|nr:PaaI family thioesterase [Vulcanisaeta sp. JCM 14467]
MSTWDELIKAVGPVSSIRDLFLKARSAGLNVAELMNNYLRSEPLFNFIGLEFVEVGDGFVRAVFPYKREILRKGGMVHGGVIMTVIDTVLGTAVMTVNDGVDQYTAELKVHFLEPLINGPFTVEGRVIRLVGTWPLQRPTCTMQIGNYAQLELVPGLWCEIISREQWPQEIPNTY